MALVWRDLDTDTKEDEILQLRKDAQRYRKLKAELLTAPFHVDLDRRRGDFYFLEGRFEAAVDALKDPNGKKQSRRTR